jgi:hypothetical protein
VEANHPGVATRGLAIPKGVIVDVLIAIFGVILTIAFEFVTLKIVDPDLFRDLQNVNLTKAQSGNQTIPEQVKKEIYEQRRQKIDKIIDKVLSVQFDLWLISLTIVLASLRANNNINRTFLVSALIGSLLCLLCLPGISDIFPNYKRILDLWTPLIVGIAILALCIDGIRTA